ncbi:hypothetical protein ACP275_03G082100 [Erythranthe tilingii]
METLTTTTTGGAVSLPILFSTKSFRRLIRYSISPKSELSFPPFTDCYCLNHSRIIPGRVWKAHPPLRVRIWVGFPLSLGRSSPNPHAVERAWLSHAMFVASAQLVPSIHMPIQPAPYSFSVADEVLCGFKFQPETR